jgi:hypothetical protein
MLGIPPIFLRLSEVLQYYDFGDTMMHDLIYDV